MSVIQLLGPALLIPNPPQQIGLGPETLSLAEHSSGFGGSVNGNAAIVKLQIYPSMNV